MGLIVVLGLLVFLLFFPAKRKKTNIQAVQKNPIKTKGTDGLKTDLESLRVVIKNKKTKKETLKEALDLVIKYHGTIHKKLGMRPHPDFDIYMDILFSICRHPNTNKNLIVGFDSALEKLNPEYKKDINEAIAKGLNSR